MSTSDEDGQTQFTTAGPYGIRPGTMLHLGDGQWARAVKRTSDTSIIIERVPPPPPAPVPPWWRGAWREVHYRCWAVCFGIARRWRRGLRERRARHLLRRVGTRQ